MSYDIQLRSRQDNLPDLAENFSPVAVDLQGGQAESIFVRVHRLLRGRYIPACVLGLVLGGAGGFFGFRSKVPMYSSTGMIHIKPYLSYVVTPSDVTGQLPAYQSFREAQVALVKQQRVIDQALATPEWRALGRTGTFDEVWQDFARNLTASTQGGEMVMVSFTDPDPKACEAAVKGVLTAYRQFYIDNEGKNQEDRLKMLESMRIGLTSDRDSRRDAVRNIAREYGTDDLRPLHQARLQDLARLQTEARQLEVQLAMAGGPTTQPTMPPAAGLPTTRPVKGPQDMTAEDIAMVDRPMREMLKEMQDNEIRISIQLNGMGPNHPKVVEAQALQKARQQAIENYVKNWKEYAIANLNDPGSLVQAAQNPEQLARLQADEKRRQLLATRNEYLKLIESIQRETKDLGLKMLDIERLKLEEKDKADSLAEVTRRIETLRTEGKTAGRVEVVSMGDRPMLAKDSRLQFGVLGGGFGIFLGFGLVAAYGLVDRRFRTLDDARVSAKLPLLGILPELPDDLAEPEQASIAAHCVHQIRTLLQIGAPGETRRTFAVTSPAAGTGKTSLTLALGVSYAAANSKTLIIDCDVIGGGLTARVETIIRRKIGQIFKRDGKITQQQLETALRLAHNSQRKLGELLVELGYLSQEDVDHALTVQEESPVGMLDALAGDSIEDCVADTGIQGLYILPVGAAMPSDVSKLSPNAIRDILARARERFDIVIIDTGPVPGSLEASAVAAAVDGVVLVVSRGEHRPLAEKSIQHLHDVGAKLAGMVFNRAEGKDMEFAATTTRLTSFDRTGRSRKSVDTEPVDTRFGPVASAVAGSSPASKNGTRANQS